LLPVVRISLVTGLVLPTYNSTTRALSFFPVAPKEKLSETSRLATYRALEM
jgi:hypothetical protein